MNRQIIPLLLKLLLVFGTSLAFGGEPDAPSSANDTGTGLADLVQVLFSFSVVVALLFVCAWWLKRWQPGLTPGQGGLQTKAVLSLGGRDRVVVVQAGDRQLLLGVSPGKIVLLGDYDQLLPEPEDRESSARRFSDLLKR